MRLVQGLKVQRERLGIKQESVSAFLHMDVRNYRRYENGDILGGRDITQVRDPAILQNYRKIFEHLRMMPIYVRRGVGTDIEESARLALRSIRRPLLVIGPNGIGKTQLLNHLLFEESMQPDSPARAWVRIGRAQDPTLLLLDDVLASIASTLADFAPGGHMTVREIWAGIEPASSKLTHLLEAHILPHTERLLLVLEHIERLTTNVRGALFALLRGYMERDLLSPASPWARLRIAMSASSTPDQLEGDDRASPFLATAQCVELRDFSEQEIQDLCSRHELSVDTKDIQIGMSFLAGHPRLWDILIQYAKHSRQCLRVLLESYRERHRIFQNHLRGLRKWIEDRAFLKSTIESLLAQQEQPISIEHYGQLFGMGLAWEDAPRSYRIRYPLYSEYLRELWGRS
jgi:hypothetical protein